MTSGCVSRLSPLPKPIELGVERQEHAQTLTNRAHVLGEKGQFAAALAGYEHALRASPRLADAWYGRGVVLQALDRNTEALVKQRLAVR